MADIQSTRMPAHPRDSYRAPVWRINLTAGGSKDVHAFGLHPSGLIDVFDDEMGSGAQPVCHIGPGAWTTIEPIVLPVHKAKREIDASTLLQDTVPMHRQPQREDSGAPSLADAREGEPDEEYAGHPRTGAVPLPSLLDSQMFESGLPTTSARVSAHSSLR